MAMKLVKKTDAYSIYLRSDDRYAVKDASKNPINGDDKVRILVEEGLIKAALPAEPVEESAEEEAPAEEAAADEGAEAAEDAAEEAPVEEAAAEDSEEAPAEDDEDK